jgi:putative salt-induced outer membrane protein YdiY
MRNFYVIYLLIINSLFAQVNIEKFNNLNNNEGILGNLSFYFSSKTGNTNIQEISTDARINFNSKSFFTFLIGQGEYGWKNGEQYSNNALVHFRYIRNYSEIINPEFFTQVNYNKRLLLLFRTLVGGGVRFSLISDSVRSFVFGSSYMFEYEKLDLSKEAVHQQVSKNNRWSNYISYSSSITNNSRISVVVYAQPRFDKFDDIRILSENNISIKLTEKLEVALQFSLRYDSQPPDGVKDFDSNIKLGFTINL